MLAYNYSHVIRILYIEKAHWTKKEMSDGGHEGHLSSDRLLFARKRPKGHIICCQNIENDRH